jgi:hypothetical protein
MGVYGRILNWIEDIGVGSGKVDCVDREIKRVKGK